MDAKSISSHECTIDRSLHSTRLNLETLKLVCSVGGHYYTRGRDPVRYSSDGGDTGDYYIPSRSSLVCIGQQRDNAQGRVK